MMNTKKVNYSYLTDVLMNNEYVLANDLFELVSREDDLIVYNGEGFYRELDYHEAINEGYISGDEISEDEYDWEPVEIENDFYQFYLVSHRAVNEIEYYTDETIFYSEKYDAYFLAVGHYGTSWEYVPLTLKRDIYLTEDQFNERLSHFYKSYGLEVPTDK